MSKPTPRTIAYWLNTVKGWAEDRLSDPQMAELESVLDYRTAIERDELLAACEALVQYRDRNDALSFQLEKADDFINDLRYAIAKAKGETK
jgi:hypothetical protein